MLSATEHLQEYQSLAGDRPHRFAFPVTWTSLTASLQLDEGTSHAVEIESAALELVLRASAPPPPPPNTNDRWEMVVPQMVRTRDKTFEPVAETSRRVPPPVDSRLLPPPLFASFQTQSLFSRALSMFGRRTPPPEEQTRLPVVARREPPHPQPAPKPALSPAEMEARRAARELLLSKIARAVREKGED